MLFSIVKVRLNVVESWSCLCKLCAYIIAKSATQCQDLFLEESSYPASYFGQLYSVKGR